MVFKVGCEFESCLFEMAHSDQFGWYRYGSSVRFAVVSSKMKLKITGLFCFRQKLAVAQKHKQVWFALDMAGGIVWLVTWIGRPFSGQVFDQI